MFKYTNQKESAFTLLELLVSLGIFSFISLATLSYATSAFRRINLENQAATVAQELRNGIDLMISELQMSRSISPYLPGDDSSLTNCAAALVVNPNDLRFIVAHDDPNSSVGVSAYYVGYSYNNSTKELLRGEIPISNISTCTIPSSDPTASSNSLVIASKINKVDNDANGIEDEIFEQNGSSININIGFKINGINNNSISENLTTTVVLRAES